MLGEDVPTSSMKISMPSDKSPSPSLPLSLQASLSQPSDQQPQSSIIYNNNINSNNTRRVQHNSTQLPFIDSDS